MTSPRPWGVTLPDVALLVVGALAIPAVLGPGSGGPGIPRLVSATLDDSILTLAFTTGVEPVPVMPGESWAVVLADGIGQVSFLIAPDGPAVVRLAVPGGARAEALLTLDLAPGAGLRDFEGGAVPWSGPVRVEGGSGPAQLPSSRTYAPEATLDGVSYLLGGRTAFGPTGQIVRVDPVTGVAVPVEATLPIPVRGGGAFADPRRTPACPEGCLYVVGGTFRDDWGVGPAEVPAIQRFDPAGGAASVLDLALPAAHAYPTVVWAGDAAYVIGGRDFREDPAWEGVYSQEIWRLDPVAGTLEPLPTRLPWGLSRAGAVHDPEPRPGCPRGCIYTVGGWVTTKANPYDLPGNPRPTDVLRFDPVTGAVTPIAISFPSDVGLDWPRPLLAGGAIWLVATPDGAGPFLYRLDPEAGELEEFPLPQVAFRSQSSFVPFGNAFLLAGGWLPDGSPVRSVDRIERPSG